MSSGPSPDAAEAVARFVRTATGGATDTAARVALFGAIRDLPYATDGAHNAAGLARHGRGDCLAKSDLLARDLALLGRATRRVRWRYHLPDQPPAVALLPSREDIHSAVEVCIGGRWVLIDATHDPPLARGGLTVADWDGLGATPPAYPFRGPLWREGRDDAAIAAALAAVAARFAGLPPGAGVPYPAAFNAWLDALRAGH